MSSYPVEKIPNEDLVYRRVYKRFILDGKVIPAAFGHDDMSCDWERYAKPSDTIMRGKKVEDNGVVSLNVGATRRIDELEVVHDPSKDNRAHSLVKGEKDSEVRLKLKNICQWCLKMGDS